MKLGDLVIKKGTWGVWEYQSKTRGLIMEINKKTKTAFIWWMNVPRYNFEEVQLNLLEVINAN